MILYCATDLLWATRIRATADALGIPSRPARTLDMLNARLADSGVRALIVDLDNPEAAMPLITRLRGPGADARDRRIRIVAFGPHVATAELDAARAAGADTVLARGAFDRRLPEILTDLNAGAPTGDAPADGRPAEG